MARSDLILSLVRAGRTGDQTLLRRSVEALIAEERAKNHHVLASQIEDSLRQNGATPAVTPPEDQIGRFVHEITPRRELSDLILPPQVLSTCEGLFEEQHRADLLRSFNLEPRHRILLVGPPGNGKTTLAEAIAHSLFLPLYSVRYEGIIASYLGETASRVARLFDFVRSNRCVLFFDEFDAIAKERGDPHDTGEVKRVVSSLLLQVDDLPTHVVVITATNHPELLDRAVWRRFQIRLTLDRPSPAQRAALLSRILDDIMPSLHTSAASLSRHLAGLSFAEVEEFATGIRRRYVLSLPDPRPQRILRDSLHEWRARASPRGEH